jgi:hypothetical protein
MKRTKINLILLLAAAAWLLSACMGHSSAGGSAPGGSSEHDLATTRLSDEGLFQVSYQSELEPAVINNIHTWTLTVMTADGAPVEDAAIAVDGGMPDHGHGLPTAPKVTENLGDGKYRVEGIRYSMPGWWTMTFEITAGDQTDTVTFNLVLN